MSSTTPHLDELSTVALGRRRDLLYAHLGVEPHQAEARRSSR
jgi:hypothetical protein